MSDLAMYIHTVFEELRTWPPLLTAVVAGIIVVIATWWLRPIYLKSRQRDRDKLRELKDLWDKSLAGDKESRRLARQELLKQVGKVFTWVTIFLGSGLVIYAWASNVAENTSSELRTGYQEYIDTVDEGKDILRWRTLRKLPGTVCDDGPVRDMERSMSETICSLESEGNSGIYQSCMAKRGWLTNRCEKSGDECVRIQAGNECCSHGEFETQPENISIRCMEMEKEERAIARWELICELRAQIEGKHKARHEIDGILITSRSYQACMLEQGWHTTLCAVGEDHCNEIEYLESLCVSNVRNVLEHGHGIYKPLYCLGREYSPSLDPIKEVPPMN